MSGSTLTTSVYTQTYTSFSGADIRAIFHQDLMINIQGLSYSITREKAPIYSMGRPDPWSFSRGKRGIAGSAVFTIYDRAPLLGFQQSSEYLGKMTETNISGDEEPKQPSEYAALAYAGVEVRAVGYADQIPPFDITLTAANEYGQLAIMRLYGVEFLNEGAGLSVDDIVNETQMTFVCRYISGWKPVSVEGSLSAGADATGALGSGLDVQNLTSSGGQRLIQFVPGVGDTTYTSYIPVDEALNWSDQENSSLSDAGIVGDVVGVEAIGLDDYIPPDESQLGSAGGT